MIIDKLNLNHLRVFECVYGNRSMTLASKESHLTQSGVSQHIKSLEEVLGTKLFDRIRQKSIPTSGATTLFKESSQGFNQIENVVLKLKTNEELCGTICIGMPSEFGRNLIGSLLSEFASINPRIHFRLKPGFDFEMNEDLLSGEIDFAFADEFNLDKRIKTEKVNNEVFGFYIQKALLAKHGAPRNDKEFYKN